MRLLEFEVKEILRRSQLSVPPGILVRDATESREAVSKLGCPAVLKPQIPLAYGERALALEAKNADDASALARDFLARDPGRTHPVKILIEKRVEGTEEFHLAIAVDRSARRPVALARRGGLGADLKGRAEARRGLSPFEPMREFEGRCLFREVGLSGSTLMEAAGVAVKLHKIFIDYHAERIEIDPLILTNEANLVLGSADLEIDDNAFSSSTFAEKHPDLSIKERWSKGLTNLDDAEFRAATLGSTYIRMDGNIGIMGTGAGSTMHLVDTVALFGGNPANFTDVSPVAGINIADVVEAQLEIVLSNANVRGLIINSISGVVGVYDIARGIVNFLSKHPLRIPLVARLRGVFEQEAQELLSKAGVPYFQDLYDAVKEIVAKVGSDGHIGG